MIPDAKCQSCDWTGPADLCGPLKNAHERVQPGDALPAGKCPLCNASSMLVDRPSSSTGPNPGPPTAETCPDISHVLATAHQIVAFPSAWTQGARARDVSGTPVDPLSPTAIRWCPNGAIQLAAYRLFAFHPDDKAFRPVAAAAIEALNRAVRLLTRNEYPDFASYNDATHHQAIAHAIHIAATSPDLLYPTQPR